jgi:thiamine pyrophosphate-dependent acetolactate synthase large subunit-like protein
LTTVCPLLLLRADRLALICGPGARSFGSIPLVVQLAEMLAIPVYDDIRFPPSFPTTHPLYLGLFDFETAGTHDVLVVIGQKAFIERNYELLPLIPESTRIIQIDVNPWEIGKL